MDNDTTYYYSVLLTILLQSFAYLPLIAQVYETQYTGNIPYSTLFMLLLASLILLIISIYKNYSSHVFVFVIYFVSIAYLIAIKTQYDTNQV